jgi:glucose/mannose transport system permease protein
VDRALGAAAMTTTAGAQPVPLPVERPRRRRRGRSVAPFKYVALFVFGVIVLLPVYVLLVTSFKGNTETDPSHAWSLPSHWTTVAWSQAWTALSPNLGNSFKLVIPATIISTVLCSLNGFVLSKWRFPGADIVFTFFLFGMFIPYQAVMIPLTQLFQDLHFPGGIPRLVFAHVVYGIPITALIFRNYYATIPDELMEAARMDRAGMFRTYWSVVLPISAPAFVVALIWQFTSIWNDFLFAVFIVTDPAKWPVTVALNNTAGSLVTPYNLQMSAALLASLPTLLVYIFLGRYFMRGLMAGALKG